VSGRRVGMALVVAAGLLVGGVARADPAWIAAVERDWFAPRAAAFAETAAALPPALRGLCAAPPERTEDALTRARAAWRSALTDWERLAGVAIGPVLDLRAQRRIDFTPTRPRMIEKAIQSAPAGPAAMELIGTPAKGLPALEWLLWVKPATPDSAACAYAVQLAEEIAREAVAIAAAPFNTRPPADFPSDLINQWVAGLERLRWIGMELPIHVVTTSETGGAPEFPRGRAGAAALAWAAQWDALRALAITGHGSLAAVLRARGQADAAVELADRVARVDAALRDLDVGDPARVRAATGVLTTLRHRVETAIAPLLGVSIGFSDADGD